MLNRYQLKKYRELRGVSTREVAACCEISQTTVTLVENGEKSITEYNHSEITKGINKAYAMKKNGTLKQLLQEGKQDEPEEKKIEKSEEKTADKPEEKTEKKDTPKKKRGRPSKKELEEKKKKNK